MMNWIKEIFSLQVVNISVLCVIMVSFVIPYTILTAMDSDNFYEYVGIDPAKQNFDIWETREFRSYTNYSNNYDATWVDIGLCTTSDWDNKKTYFNSSAPIKKTVVDASVLLEEDRNITDYTKRKKTTWSYWGAEITKKWTCRMESTIHVRVCFRLACVDKEQIYTWEEYTVGF